MEEKSWVAADIDNSVAVVCAKNFHCEKYKKDTLIVNLATLAYFHCGEGRNRPKKISGKN